MSEHDLEKLLGGFAADTLTAEERKLLYSAALQDQQLFNVLADEQALKELLSNPDVRRRLLASLEQKSTSHVDGPLPWLDWLRRPAGLAFAGGLTTAALAVVLGVRIYQDSLQQAAQSVETEAAKPAAPPLPAPPVSQPPPPRRDEPERKAKEAAGPSKDLLVPPAQQTEQVGPDKNINAPLSALSKSAEEATSTADKKLASPSTQPATMSESLQMEAPAISARALFYTAQAARQHPGNLSRPLGLRYSVVVREADGEEREVDVAAASKVREPIFLTLEANQDAYLQVWRRVGSSTAQLQLPEKETGQLSLKITAGHRQYIQLSTDREPATLTACLSLVPFGSTTGEGTAKLDQLSLHQLQESVSGLNQTGSPERATYIVNQDPSTNAQIAVAITLGR